MWPPADIYALPTAQELIDAKSAIETVKAQLNDALLALARAKLRVDEINKELFERKAWIAPVRYLSFDVLSLIFEFCGEDDWRTTLLITEVSRHWKETVLATPRAWAFLDLNDFRNNHPMIYRFFSHSGHCPLHIHLPFSIKDPTRILSSVQKRIKCLSTRVIHNYVEDRVFPILDRLSVYGYDKGTEIWHFSAVWFPSLRHLLCNAYLINSIGGSSGAAGWKFPLLQTLSLQMTSDLAWLDLLTAVSNTLISLRLSLVTQCAVQNPQITLPVLRCLDIQSWDDYQPLWPLDLKTPVLEAYVEHTRRPWDTSLYHEDTHNVRRMRSNRLPTLSSFPLLEVLQFPQESPLSAFFDMLASNESLSPNLREVEVATYNNQLADLFHETLLEVNRCRRISVKLVVSYQLMKELPYAIEQRPCGDGMPCNED